MDLSPIIATAAVVSILANALKVCEFGSSLIKKSNSLLGEESGNLGGLHTPKA